MPTTASASRGYRDHLIVLRTHELGEADRIVVGLTAHHGLVRAVAKGVRRASSKMGARLEPFMVSDVALVSGRSLDTVTQAVTARAYAAPIVADWEAYVAASTLCEVAEHLGQAEEESPSRLFPLTAGALSALARSLHDPTDVLGSFLLRAMALSGWFVELFACVRCGDQAPAAWSVQDGGTVCSACLRAGDRPLSGEVLAHLQALALGDWPTADGRPREDDRETGQGVPEEGVRREAARLIRRYVQWHVDHAFRTFDLLERPA